MKARKFVTGIQNAMVLVLFLGAPLSTNGQVESGRFVGRITDVQGGASVLPYCLRPEIHWQSAPK